MKVIRADLSDVETLGKMNKRLIEDERHPTNQMTVQQLAQRMINWLQNEYTCYLATEDGNTVAYCLFRDDCKYYYMRQLFVEREHRRKGIATNLLDWMYKNIWVDKKVRLDVLSANEEAIAFYKAYGFRIGCLRMEK